MNLPRVGLASCRVTSQRCLVPRVQPSRRRWSSVSAKLRDPRNYGTAAVVGVAAGFAVGAVVAYYTTAKPKRPLFNPGSGSRPTVIKEIPDVEISRKVVFPNDDSGLKLVLFQYSTCPFCCKVRAFLDYHGISYDVVEVNPVFKQQMAWTKDYKKVPILLVQGGDGYIQLNDSSTIISTLASYLQDRKGSVSLEEVANFYPSIDFTDEEGNIKREVLNRYFLMYQTNTAADDMAKEIIVEERKWRQWADKVLVHTLSPNVYRTRAEAFEAFDWFSQVGDWDKHFTSWERNVVTYVGANAMWMIGKRIKKKYELNDDVRKSLYESVNTWITEVQHIKGPGDFHGGRSPDLADLAVYGVLNSIEGCQAFKDLREVTNVAPWYDKVKRRLASPLTDKDDTTPAITIEPKA